jgi:hypothetical protein
LTAIAGRFNQDFRDARGAIRKQRSRAARADRLVLDALRKASSLNKRQVMNATGLSPDCCEGAFKRLAKCGAILVTRIPQSRTRLFAAAGKMPAVPGRYAERAP